MHPTIALLMGSSSDWDTLRHAAEILDRFQVPYEKRVVSAHRMPDDMFDFAQVAAGRGLRAIIAGAGGAAHLPGMLAAKTTVPVLGVRGDDALFKRHLKPVQDFSGVTKGVPVGGGAH